MKRILLLLTAIAAALLPCRAEKAGEVAADVAQFAPVALPWAMKACGAPVRSGWGRMAVSQAFGAAITTGAVYAGKYSVDRMRPDGSDRHSFPSGHAARAFMGATAAAIELEGLSPWYAAGAYTWAAAVAAQRVMADRHYPTDVVAGAGIGILAATAGYYLGDLIFGPLPGSGPDGLDRLGEQQSFIEPVTGLVIPLGGRRRATGVGGESIVALPALASGVKGGYALGSGWHVTASLTLASVPLKLDHAAGPAEFLGMSNSLSPALGAAWSKRTSRRISLMADAEGGYRFNMRFGPDCLSTDGGSAFGAIDAGVIVHLTARLSCRATAGWQIWRYGYTLAPTSAPLSGTANAVTASIAARLHL